MQKFFLSFLAFALSLPLLAFENLIPNDGTFESDGGYFTRFWCDRPNALSWSVVSGESGRCLQVQVPAGVEKKGISGAPFAVKANTLYTYRMKAQVPDGVAIQVALVNCDWKDTTFMSMGPLDEEGRCAVEFTPKYTGDYWVLLEFTNISNRDAVVRIDDVEFFLGNTRKLALESMGESGVNLLKGNNGYEGGEGYFSKLWCGQGCPWILVEGDDAPQGAMYVTTTVDAKDCHSYTGSPMYFDNEKQYVFSCWIRADKPRTMELINVQTNWQDSQWHRFDVTTEWRRVEVPFTVKLSSDYRMILELINRKYDEPVQVFFDGAKVEIGTKATPFVQENKLYSGAKLYSEHNGIFFQDEKPVLSLQAIDLRGDKPQDATWTLTVNDYQQNVVLESSQPAQWNEKGIYKAEIPMPVDKLGLFVYRVKWSDAQGKKLSEDMGVYTVVQKPLADDPEVTPYLGVNSNVPNGVERLGVRWTEADVKWLSLMPNPNTIDYESHLRRFHDLKSRGFKVKLSLVHLPGSPNWVHRPEEAAEAKKWGIPESQGFFGTDEAMEKLSVAFEELIRRAGDDIDLLEIGGEDELISGSEPYYRKKYPQFVRQHGHVYGPVCTDLAKITTLYLQAAKRANPTLPIAAGRPSGGSPQVQDFPFSREVLSQVDGEFQYFPMDCYSFKMRYLDPSNMPNIGSPNREYQSVFKNANAMTQTYLQGQKPFVSEYGFAIDNRLAPDHPLQQEETRRMTSAVLTARLLGSPFFFWFNTMGCVESSYFDYGMWHEDTPMLLIPAMSQVARVVERVRQYDSRLGTEDSNLKLGVFGQKDIAYLVLWTEQNDNAVKLTLPEGVKCVDFLGNAVEVPADGVFTAHLLPTYISLEGEGAYDALHAALESAEDRANGLTCSLKLEAGRKGALIVKHLDAESTEAARVAYSFGDSTPKTASKKAGKAFPWVIPLTDIPGEASEMAVTLTDSKKASTTVVMSLSPTKLSKGENFIREFGDARKDIIPPDPWIRWDGSSDLGGKIYMELNGQKLVVKAEITDDTHKNNQTGEMLWNGDCFQFAILPEVVVTADPTAIGYGPKDVEIGVALTANGPECVVFRGEYNAPLNAGQECQVTRDDAKGVTTYRIELDCEALGLVRKGQYFRFASVVFDDDEGSGQSYWFQTSPGITGTKNVNLFQLFQMP